MWRAVAVGLVPNLDISISCCEGISFKAAVEIIHTLINNSLPFYPPIIIKLDLELFTLFEVLDAITMDVVRLTSTDFYY
jgi:hypothetical protein